MVFTMRKKALKKREMETAIEFPSKPICSLRPPTRSHRYMVGTQHAHMLARDLDKFAALAFID